MALRWMPTALLFGAFLVAGAGSARSDEPATKEPAPATKSADGKDAPAKDAKQTAAARAAEEYELQKLFADTLDQVQRNYVKDISRRELMEAAIRGVLDKLDPYSNYISPDDLGQFKTSVESQFGGIGIQVDLPHPGALTIVSPIVGSPAYKAGLQSGDVIVAVDGETADNIKSIDDAVRRLKGEPGTKVTVTVRRRGTGQRKTVTLEREVIQLETVLGDRRKDNDAWDFMLDREKRIGYIRITAFSRDTERDVRAALDQLKSENMRGLILDLRFNPGGLLTSAIGVADLFVTQGKIVSTEGRNSAARSWEAQKEGTYEGFPMVVLVNRYSASASEIVSACLQDHKRAVVIGERSWGKGSVQNVIELEGGKSALKLTTASYQRPSGKNIHRFPDASESEEWGVKPDQGFEMKLPDSELGHLVRYRHDRDILAVSHSPAALADQQSAEKDKKPESDKPDDQDKAAAAKPSDEKKADEKAADAKPTETKPTETKPTEPKPDETKPADAQPADQPAKESPASDEKPASEPKPEKTTEPSDGERPSDKAPEKFVDRQLQRAVDYLTSELAKAG